MNRAVALPASILASLAVSACAPNNAKLTDGSYIAFLSDGTSLSLAKEKIVPEDYDQNWTVDCRDFETPEDEEALKLDNALKICGPVNWPPLYEEWAKQAGFRVVTEQLDPWRGEALITAEGDLQISFHHHAPGGADMRFVLSVDPDFGPVTCQQKEDGSGTERIPLDGDWVGEWSKELDALADLDDDQRAPYEHLLAVPGGRLVFLNAFSYQLNPVDVDGQIWELPETWVAGAAEGRFSEEDVYHRKARYGEPSVYNLLEVEGSDSTAGTFYTGVDPHDLWYCDLADGADTMTGECEDRDSFPDTLDGTMVQQDERAREVADGVRIEIERMTKVVAGDPDENGNPIYEYAADADPVFTYAPIAHTNFWRRPDGLPAGLDGWSELHYNYVVFSGDSQLEEGGSATGAFSLVLDSASSSSRVFIKGSFEIPRIRKDHWKTENLAEQKLIEAGVELCSAASEHDAAPAAGE